MKNYHGMKTVVDYWEDSYCVSKWTPTRGWHVPKNLREYFKLEDAKDVLQDMKEGMHTDNHGKESKRAKYKLVRLAHVDI